MDEVICVRESNYRSALTRGKQYKVLATNTEKQQVRVKGDNGRSRWFPDYCFGSVNQPVITMVSYEAYSSFNAFEQDTDIEVIVHLSDSQTRHCWFATPTALSKSGGWIDGTQIPFHYSNRNVIIANQLSEDLIGRMLRYIDGQGKLFECTSPIDQGAAERFIELLDSSDSIP
jgi:hypothetical protein